MSAISAVDFLVTPLIEKLSLESNSPSSAHECCLNLCDVPNALYDLKSTRTSIDLNDFVERAQLVCESRSNRLGSIVLARNESRATLVADVLDCGWAAFDVIRPPTVRADASSSQPSSEHFNVNTQEDRADLARHWGKGRIKGCNLRGVSWKPVEDHSRGGVWFRQSVTNHSDRNLVRHELPRVNVCGRASAKLAAGRDLCAEEVARGHMCGASGGGQRLRLRPLPCAWGAEKDQDHLIKPS
jgi:hypothetical protein